MTTDRDSLLARIKAHPSYRLAYEDDAFLESDDMRAVRLALEFTKPDFYLRAHNIRSTIVVFGSSRLLSPELARARLEALVATHGESATGPAAAAIAAARKHVEYARYYEEARCLGRLVPGRFPANGEHDFVVVTGGGPGIMEAANRGATETGARSIGLNITLPHEQEPNPFITPGLCLRFRYFGLRKMHFLLRARALVAFPGGYGTLDELFEALTLVQTGKIAPMPIVLVGRDFWRRAVDFDYLVGEGMLAPDDVALFTVAETAEEVLSVIERFYRAGRPDAADRG